MSRNQRLALLGLAVVVVVVAFVVASSGGSNSTSSSENKVVEVKGGKPVGGIQKLTYKKGGTIRFRVRSDVADEVHFHGYDKHADVKAGGTVAFDVPAAIDGKFVVELEAHKEQIAQVEVQP